MNLNNNNNIDWSSPDVLMQLIKEIKAPLDSIIEANQKRSKSNAIITKDRTSNIIFSSSQEIAKLIDNVVKLANDGKAVEKVPLIYEIYNSNTSVQSMCKNEINPNKISKQDASWLVDMEG